MFARRNLEVGTGVADAAWMRSVIRSVVREGSVYVNGYFALDAALPFGGFKQSDWGREMGPEVLELYTEVKAVSIKL
jgi:acyl-CoA reductase-like NAD-dependent aldehyde dehydrogenase